MTEDQEAAMALPELLERFARFWEPENHKHALKAVIYSIMGQYDQVEKLMDESELWSERATDYMQANEPGWKEMKPEQKALACRAKAAWERQALEAGHDH